MFSDGRPSDALRRRLEVALELYEAGRVKQILITGMGGDPYYDEVRTMAAWLLERGVPREALLEDDRGIRTLDSMVRAARVFGLSDVCVCTQGYHLPRALFLAHKAGLQPVGMDADRGEARHSAYDSAREFLARTRAFFDVYIWGTEPASLEGDPAP